MELESRVGPLLDWYRAAARDLPWRRTRDPYGIWVSEIMLQQTQVRTVVAYWERWMREFPTIPALAAAAEEKVLKLWEGLGYYRRARNLHAAARQVVELHEGIFPGTLEAILALPGIGRYTAGAIHSIAFNQPSPILDGNVVRVLTRWDAIAGDPAARTVSRRLWEAAGRLVRAAHETRRREACSHLNQALMELGATVCTPRQPLCEGCPVAEGCRARATGAPENFPRASRRPASEVREFLVWIIRRKGLVAVRQRAREDVNGGFWEFPCVETTGTAPDVAALAASSLGPLARRPVRSGEVRHAITRYRIRQTAYRLDLAPDARIPEGWRWVDAVELDGLALTTAHRRLARGHGAALFTASERETPDARYSLEARARHAPRGSKRTESRRGERQ